MTSSDELQAAYIYKFILANSAVPETFTITHIFFTQGKAWYESTFRNVLTRYLGSCILNIKAIRPNKGGKSTAMSPLTLWFDNNNYTFKSFSFA